MNRKPMIAVLYGGKSGEHEVSRISAGSVIRNFDRERFELLLIGIDEDGRWFLQDESQLERVLAGEIPGMDSTRPVSALPGSGLYAGTRKLELDCVFPVLHGTNGEDGTVQGFLEILDIPYAGAGILASAFGMDKIRAKETWMRQGIPVVPFTRYERFEYERACESTEPAQIHQHLFQEWSDELGLPFFIKPCRAGSSVGISKIKDPSSLEQALRSAFEYDSLLLIEKAVNAREIECSVLGNEEIRAFPPGEVISHHEFYDYSGKYLDPEGASFDIPASLPQETIDRIRRYAISAFEAIAGEGLARVDFFVEKTSGELFINEVNTMPGFTKISMYPKMCEAGGLSYSSLLSTLVDLGIARHRRKATLNLHFHG